MELKVWVDGIQRVVCGVTDASTCQDVVYALAHATGQTGRFTLVEKWRNSERLLAPQEQPLKVLTKWGEYANDVHFVMRKSSGDSKITSGNAPNTGSNQNNKRQHDFLRSFSPSGGSSSSCNNNSSKQKIPLTSKEIKKSLTFSCGSSGSVSSENSTPPMDSDSRNLKNREGRSKQDLPKGVVRGVPQKPRDSESPSSKFERPKYPPSYDEAVSRSSGRFPTSHLSIAAQPPDEESPSSKRPHLSSRHSPVDRGSPSSHAPVHHPRQQPNSHKSHLIMEQSRDFRVRSPDPVDRSSPSRAKSPSKSSPEKIFSPSDEPLKLKKALSSKLDGGEKQSDCNENKSPSSPKNNCQPEDLSRDPQYQDLLRLVSLQREKLDNQQAEVSQFDAEIVYWENRLQEQEEKLSLLQEEVCHLERTHHEQEGELMQLDRRSFNEEVDLGRQEERTLRSELTLARSQLANCETELLQCRQRIRLILEEIAEERRLRSIREEQDRKEREEQEQRLHAQLECLQQQIKDKGLESDTQKGAAEQAKQELQDLDLQLTDRQQELEKLVCDIREANLRSLSLVPSEEGKFILEGNFYNRPGSTRKIIGSPRQLENAVPTNKNPHGVWV